MSVERSVRDLAGHRRARGAARSRADPRFIALDNPAAAVSFCQNRLDRAEALREFPERGGHLRERPGARFSVVGYYLIIYRADQVAATVRILRFWHGARERRRLQS